MYLKKLYQHHKGWFVLIVLFATAQITNNIRQDIAFSPIYQYGMYSEYISPKDTLGVYEITVNGKLLQTKNFSPQGWDKIVLPIRYYANSTCNNSGIYYTDIQRLLQKIYITTDSSNFIFPFDKYLFLKWYQPYLSSIINEKIDSMQINYVLYKHDTTFHKLQSASFAQLCK